MSASLSDVVSVQITLQIAGLTRVGFGTPLVMARNVPFADPYRSYTKSSDMVTDGFDSAHPAVRMAGSIFAQQPHPANIIVGRMDQSTPAAQKVRLTPANLNGTGASNSTAYVVTVNGTDITFTSDATASAAEVTAGLATALNTAGPVATAITATDNTGTLDIVSDVAGTLFTVSVDPVLLKQSNQTTALSGDDLIDDLTNIMSFTNDFYTIHVADIVANADMVTFAAYVGGLTNPPKMLIIDTADDSVYDPASTTDIGYVIQQTNNARVAVFYNQQAYTTFPGAAWAGLMLPKDPGSATWNLKTLSGVSASDINATAVAALDAKAVNFYVNMAGRSVTRNGTTGSTTRTGFIDVTWGTDWLTARIQENMFATLASVDKIPYTDAGGAVVESVVRSTLQQGVDAQFLAADPKPQVFVPLVANVSPTDRAARLFPDVTFSAFLSGAFHKIEIQGTISA